MRHAKYVLGQTLVRKMGRSSHYDTGERERDRGSGRSTLDLSTVPKKILKPKSLSEESPVSQEWARLRIVWHLVTGHGQPWEE